PKFGKVISWLRRPLYISFFASLLGGVIMINWLKDKNKLWKPKSKKSIKFPDFINADQLGKSGESYFLGLGIFLIISLILGGISFSKPTEKSIPQDYFYS